MLHSNAHKNVMFSAASRPRPNSYGRMKAFANNFELP